MRRFPFRGSWKRSSTKVKMPLRGPSGPAGIITGRGGAIVGFKGGLRGPSGPAGTITGRHGRIVGFSSRNRKRRDRFGRFAG